MKTVPFTVAKKKDKISEISLVKQMKYPYTDTTKH